MKMATSRIAPCAVAAQRSFCVATPAAAGKQNSGVIFHMVDVSLWLCVGVLNILSHLTSKSIYINIPINY